MDLSQAKHGHLRLRILNCKGLKTGDFGARLPDPFVVAQFTEACGMGVGFVEVKQVGRLPRVALGRGMCL